MKPSSFRKLISVPGRKPEAHCFQGAALFPGAFLIVTEMISWPYLGHPGSRFWNCKGGVIPRSLLLIHASFCWIPQKELAILGWLMNSLHILEKFRGILITFWKLLPCSSHKKFLGLEIFLKCDQSHLQLSFNYIKNLGTWWQENSQKT